MFDCTSSSFGKSNESPRSYRFLTFEYQNWHAANGKPLQITQLIGQAPVIRFHRISRSVIHQYQVSPFFYCFLKHLPLPVRRLPTSLRQPHGLSFLDFLDTVLSFPLSQTRRWYACLIHHILTASVMDGYRIQDCGQTCCHVHRPVLICVAVHRISSLVICTYFCVK